MANFQPTLRTIQDFDSFDFDDTLDRVINQDIIDNYSEPKGNLSDRDHSIINTNLLALGYNLHENSVKNLFGYHKPGENICYIVIKNDEMYIFDKIDLNEYFKSPLSREKTKELLSIMQILGFVRKIEKNKIIFTKNGKILYQIERRATSFGKVIFRRSSFKKVKRKRINKKRKK